MRAHALLLLFALLTAPPSYARTLSVGTGESIQKAVERARPGDVVLVEDGEYAGFRPVRSGTANAPITIRARKSRGAVIVRDGPEKGRGIRIAATHHIVIDGFWVKGPNTNGIFATVSRGVVIRNCLLERSRHTGVLTGFCDDVVVEFNESRNNRGSGIYVSNSCRRATIRGNRLHHNGRSGIHMNGDRHMKGPRGEAVDGLIHNCLLEGNIIYENGRGGASAAISMDGVRDSVIRNNLLYNNHNIAGGIVPFHIDAGGGSINNVIVNNTVIQSADGGCPVEIHHDSTGCIVFNNILIHLGGKPHLDVHDAARSGLRSDRNLVSRKARFGRQDANSKVATVAALFPRYTERVFILSKTSPAVGRGVPLFADKPAPHVDLQGTPRIVKVGQLDVGCYALPRKNE